MPLCFKKSYVSKEDAELAAKLMRKLPEYQHLYVKGKLRKRSRMNAYQYSKCKEWHLTSQK